MRAGPRRRGKNADRRTAVSGTNERKESLYRGIDSGTLKKEILLVYIEEKSSAKTAKEPNLRSSEKRISVNGRKCGARIFGKEKQRLTSFLPSA